jgi:hypothetical protein
MPKQPSAKIGYDAIGLENVLEFQAKKNHTSLGVGWRGGWCIRCFLHRGVAVRVDCVQKRPDGLVLEVGERFALSHNRECHVLSSEPGHVCIP